MAAIDASLYEEIIIESSDGKRSVDLRFGIVALKYFEDLFSPTLTAQMTIVNTGGTIPTEDGSYQSIYSGLPLRGGERVSIKIAGNSDTNKGLDLSTKDNYMYVSKITNVIREGQREIFTLHLVSREAIANETSRVYKKFSKGPIDKHVRDILKENLQSQKPLKYDPVEFQYSFIGNLRRPFNVLVWLAAKSIPTTGIPGYFFYETIEGYNFKSVENLIAEGKQNVSAEYFHQEDQDYKKSRDKRILSYNINVNNDLLENLRLGTYAAFFAEYDPYLAKFSLPQEGKRTLRDFSGTNLGDDPEIPQILSSNGFDLSNIPSRILTSVLDVGTLEKNVAYDYTKTNYRDALFRYNYLFTQVLNMTVPLNTELKAGNVIKCNFLKISNNSREFDREQSGLYMIKELCHHFDGTQSLTSMKLLRDTFGDV